MAKRLQFHRLVWLAFLLVIAFAGLGYRLVDIQVVRHEELKLKAQKNTQREFLLEPRRGDILDAKGNLLATTTYVKTICANPRLAGTNYLQIARALAPVLNESEAKLAQKLQPRLRKNKRGELLTNSPVQFVVLKKRVPVKEWEQAQKAMAGLNLATGTNRLTKAQVTYYRGVKEKAIYARDEQMRVYPSGQLAAHVVGFTGIVDREVSDTPVTEISGREGIEQSLNEKLTGVRGWRCTETDGGQNELVALREQNVEARDGFNVVLTIDSVIQHIAEAALLDAMQKHSPISASCLVVRPKTGEILAMATLPTYDPTQPGTATRNRVITDRVEPGSTFKIVVVSAALNEKLVRLTDIFDCENGAFHYGGRILRDHDKYGLIPLERVITKSSNIGAAKVGLLLGQDRLYSYIKTFGFGVNTEIPLIGEVPGRVDPVKKWSKITIVQLPMGHGLTVTPLQMVMAMCAIANKGVLMRPMIVDRFEDQDHQVVAKYTPQTVRRVISEEAAAETVKALKTVVGPDGTAPKAAMDHYTVAGKTGTAQKVENKVYVRKYFSSFIGFFPADDPELCIMVALDEPRNGYYGGQTAAPYFKQIAESAANYLNIKPDLNPEAPSADALATAESRVNKNRP